MNGSSPSVHLLEDRSGESASLPRLILNVALTGMVPRKVENPALPVTPDEIAEDARLCVEAGASIVHLHARDSEGAPTEEPEAFADIIRRIRSACDDVIVCVTTSGRRFPEFERRAQVLELEGDVKPEMASLTLGSLNFPKQASINEPETIWRLAERMNERGIVPELEVFDFGMADYAKFLIRHGILRPPFYANLLLGSLGTLSASPFNLATLAASLPEGTTWAAAGIGRYEFWVNAMAITMGGHVRVGLEDNLFMDTEKTVPATNVSLVERLVRLAQAAGREVASPAEVRALIGLPPR
jgi:3-keto-5-aminohexanoate cleavage enzyme